ncbi:MAG: FUSC family protein [Clostridia bacterium]|nr:FUSC family protein [Clostridia bacterium]
MKEQSREGYIFDWYFPPLGQRIVKTSAAVLICLMFYWLRGYRGGEMPAEACITAIICMQPYVHDTAAYARDRFIGSLIGAFWGLMFLLLLLIFPVLGKTPLLLYPLMGVGVLISLYSAVVMRRPDTSGQAAIVFICVVIAYPEIDAPLQQAFHRMLDVLVGTAAAIGVNVLRLPREKRRDRLFFARTRDIVPDQLAQMHSAVLFRLNYLFNDGAKICLMSEHAPAFLLSQLGNAKVNVPLIVMDGAGIYDAQKNEYLSVETLPPASSAWLMERLNELHASYFIYTVHNHRTCIFHQGKLSKGENLVYERMKRSPYRHYLEGDSFEPGEIVYIKVIAATVETDSILVSLYDSLPHRGLRAAMRAQAGLPGSGSLYFYSANATMERAEEKLLRMLREKEPELQPVEVFSNTGYRTEHDAVHLVHQLGKSYEPLALSAWLERWRNRRSGLK